MDETLEVVESLLACEFLGMARMQVGGAHRGLFRTCAVFLASLPISGATGDLTGHELSLGQGHPGGSRRGLPL